MRFSSRANSQQPPPPPYYAKPRIRPRTWRHRSAPRWSTIAAGREVGRATENRQEGQPPQPRHGRQPALPSRLLPTNLFTLPKVLTQKPIVMELHRLGIVRPQNLLTDPTSRHHAIRDGPPVIEHRRIERGRVAGQEDPT